MSDLLTTIPDAQDIHGLLRRWSPVFLTGKDAGYKSAVADPERLSIVTAEGAEDVDSVALDLTDPTGRVHAAWWVRGWISSRGGWAGLTTATLDLLVAVCDGHPMTSAQIDALARLVLRLAGRAS